MLPPGFEPGIPDSKGQYACPVYTTGARGDVRLRPVYIRCPAGVSVVFLYSFVGLCVAWARSSVWLEHPAHNRGVMGSSPFGPTTPLASVPAFDVLQQYGAAFCVSEWEGRRVYHDSCPVASIFGAQLGALQYLKGTLRNVTTRQAARAMGTFLIFLSGNVL